uniref:Uncharacterized protein n=1 Tax=Anopheles atroparvus TaxID=41427 RepID=A0A182J3A7_ANOAO
MNMTANLLLVVQYRADYIYQQINARAGELMHDAETPNGIVKLYLMHTDTTVTVQCILEIELLTIEYLNRDYTVHVKGLYAIDYTMLFSIVASTTSYMIVLVQFYLQE